MIKSVANLLDAFKEKELELIKKHEIVKHPSLIGQMYEGLTQDILKKTIFENLDLRVTSGKIKNSNDQFSDEIDCMLVEGEGDKLPHTDKYIYDSRQVIAVIEVKKYLYSKDLISAYDNLNSVKNIVEFQEMKDGEFTLFEDAYEMILHKKLPHTDEIENLSQSEKLIYHIFINHTLLPVRIIWGYWGFTNEKSLREAFAKYIESNTLANKGSKTLGFGPHSFPDLIICNNNTIIKNNGMPFYHPFEDADFYWPLCFSDSGKSSYYFLGQIWTKIAHRFDLDPSFFFDDVSLYNANKFLDCRYNEEFGGWEVLYRNYDIDTYKPESRSHIIYLDEIQMAIYQILIKEGKIGLIDNSELIKFLSDNNVQNIDEFFESLHKKGLVTIENNTAFPLYKDVAFGVTPKGEFYVCNNKYGEVPEWLIQEVEKKNS